MSHSLFLFNHSPIEMFCTTILLRSIRRRKLLLYARLAHEHRELICPKFSPTIRTQSKEFHTERSLSPGLKLLKDAEGFRLCSKGINTCKGREIVNKSSHIVATIVGQSWKLAKVRMDKFQGFCGMGIGNGKRFLSHFPGGTTRTWS